MKLNTSLPQGIRHYLTQEKFHHSWLLIHPDHEVLAKLLREVALAIFRIQLPEQKYQVCHQRILKGFYPDYMVLEDKENYSTQGVRQFCFEMSKGSFETGTKIGVIPEAQNLSLPAMNSLLKTLEEPTQGCYFLLGATDESKMIPTILSRCVVFRLHQHQKSDEEQTWEDWLDLKEYFVQKKTHLLKKIVENEEKSQKAIYFLIQEIRKALVTNNEISVVSMTEKRKLEFLDGLFQIEKKMKTPVITGLMLENLLIKFFQE